MSLSNAVLNPRGHHKQRGAYTMPSVHVHLEGEEDLGRWRLGLPKKFKLRLVVLGAEDHCPATCGLATQSGHSTGA